MRLWHYKLIPFLPKSQLIAQWRELNSIFKKQDKHILINYVYDYSGEDLFIYTKIVVFEMIDRGIQIKSFKNFEKYFRLKNQKLLTYKIYRSPFKKHHNDRYLLQCFYNLQEKYDRGQKDFSEEQYKKLENFVFHKEFVSFDPRKMVAH